jgi:KDO2-lipid IV(A) lauroyltransferase
MAPRRKKVRVKDIGWWAVYFLLQWAVRVSPVCLSLKLAEAFGRLHYRLDAKIRGRIRANVRLLFDGRMSEGEINDAVRRNFINRHKQFAERFLLGRLCSNDLPMERVISSIEGIEHLDAALSLGRGAVLVEPHFGSFDLIWYALARKKGYAMNIFRVLAPPNFEDIGEYMARSALAVKVKSLSVLPVKWIYIRPGAFFRPVFLCLKKNEILYSMSDGSRGERFSLVDFMGHSMQLPSGNAYIAARSGAPMIPVFIVREKDDRHRIIIEEPIPLSGYDDRSIDAAMACYGRRLEAYVGRYPCHWMTILRIRKKEVVNGRAVIEIPTLYLLESDYFYSSGPEPASG